MSKCSPNGMRIYSIRVYLACPVKCTTISLGLNEIYFTGGQACPVECLTIPHGAPTLFTI